MKYNFTISLLVSIMVFCSSSCSVKISLESDKKNLKSQASRVGQTEITQNGIYQWNIDVLPFHRYYLKQSDTNQNHFYTTNAEEIGTIKYQDKGKYGYINEGVAGFCLKESQYRSIPLYRYYNNDILDHFYTTNAQEIGTTTLGEVKKGYKYEGVACHCFEKKIEGTSPLHRYWGSSVNDHFYTTNFDELKDGNSVYKYEGVQCYVPTKVVNVSPSK